MRRSKIPVQELWLKIGGGRIREGGGVIAGFYCTSHANKLSLCQLVVWL